MSKYLIKYSTSEGTGCKCCYRTSEHKIELEFDSADEAREYVLNYMTNKIPNRYGGFLKVEIISVELVEDESTIERLFINLAKNQKNLPDDIAKLFSKNRSNLYKPFDL